jgi:hypothetical protein
VSVPSVVELGVEQAAKHPAPLLPSILAVLLVSSSSRVEYSSLPSALISRGRENVGGRGRAAAEDASGGVKASERK